MAFILFSILFGYEFFRCYYYYNFDLISGFRLNIAICCIGVMTSKLGSVIYHSFMSTCDCGEDYGMCLNFDVLGVMISITLCGMCSVFNGYQCMSSWFVWPVMILITLSMIKTTKIITDKSACKAIRFKYITLHGSLITVVSLICLYPNVLFHQRLIAFLFHVSAAPLLVIGGMINKTRFPECLINKSYLELPFVNKLKLNNQSINNININSSRKNKTKRKTEKIEKSEKNVKIETRMAKKQNQDKIEKEKDYKHIHKHNHSYCHTTRNCKSNNHKQVIISGSETRQGTSEEIVKRIDEIDRYDDSFSKSRLSIDYIGNSHQIWHVFVILACLVVYIGCYFDDLYWKSTVCQSNSMNDGIFMNSDTFDQIVEHFSSMLWK